MAKQVTTVRVSWDKQDPQNIGWYVEAFDARGDIVDDSMKVWFPVNADQFGADEHDELVAALVEAFPGAAIEH